MKYASRLKERREAMILWAFKTKRSFAECCAAGIVAENANIADVLSGKITFTCKEKEIQKYIRFHTETISIYKQLLNNPGFLS